MTKQINKPISTIPAGPIKRDRKTKLSHFKDVIEDDKVGPGSVLETSRQRYQLGVCFGKGGFSEIYPAVADSGEIMIAKVATKGTDNAIFPSLSAEFDTLQKFTGYPNIVNVVDGVVEGKQQFIIFEYVAGVTLKDVIKNSSEKLRWSALKNILLDVADAIITIHTEGFLHRDIKTQNVMVTPDGNAVLLDFGLAQEKGVPKEKEYNSVAGTYGYMPPELLMSSVMDVELDERADVYSFGALMYYTLAGRSAFSSTQDIFNHIAGKICLEPPSTANPDANIPAELDEIVLKAMLLKREDRYSNMQEMRDTIERVEIE